LDKTKATVTTLATSLKDVEVDSQFHELLMKRELNMIKDGEVEFKDVHERLHYVYRDLDVLDLKCGHTKQWARSLRCQVQLMCRGSRMYVISLPIENPVALAANTIGMFFVSPCLICGLFFFCNNIVLTLCGCTYHPFCICVYLASKATKCATLGC
jgi:hypothetical protein